MSWDIGGDYDNWLTTEPEDPPERPTLEDLADIAYDRYRDGGYD